MKLALEAWRNREFLEPRPAMSTLRKLCGKGQLPAVKIGGSWYIEMDKPANDELPSGDPLVDEILRNHAATK